MHTFEYLQVADRGVSRLPWSSKSLRTYGAWAPTGRIGCDCVSTVRVQQQSLEKEPDDLCKRVRDILPQCAVYRREDGEEARFFARDAINGL